MSLIADGGGSVRPQTSLPTVTPAQHPPASTAASDAAARARALQRELEALLERLREAQRRAEAARKRAIEAAEKAEQARKAAEAARKQAEHTKSVTDQAAAAKAQQDYKVQDARMKKSGADANLQDKDVALLRAQVAQKREQKKAPDGQAGAAADQKVKDAQSDRDGAAQTNDLSKLYLDSQEKESKAQDAEAKVTKLTPTPGRPSDTVTDSEWTALADAKTDATRSRTDADGAAATFKSAVGAQAETAFYGDTPAAPPAVPAAPGSPAASIADDPLHSPLLNLLQVPPGAPAKGNAALPFAPVFTATTPLKASTTTPFSGFLTQAQSPTAQVVRTLSGIADGKSVDQIAGEQHIGADQVLAQARAAGVDIRSSTPGTDVQVTTLKKGDVTLTYTHDTQHDTVTVKGSYADATAPGGRKTIEATQDGNGVLTQTVKDPKTGNPVTHAFDPKAGTRTDTVVAADGTCTETTTDLTGAPVLRPVKPGEGYLQVAKAAGLTPEQLLALNPDVDYGVALKPGQELVVAGVPTTVRTSNPDRTSLERTTAADGTQQVVATSASGRRTVLMGDPDKKGGTGEAARKAIFDDGKTVAQTAKSLGLTEDQVLAALPPGTVDATPAGADNAGIGTRTIYDPATNRTVIETSDPRHDRFVRQVIDDKTVFKVRQYDDTSKKWVIKELTGGAGYAQQLADQKVATVGDYAKQIKDIDANIYAFHHMGESTTALQAQRAALVADQKTAQGQADVAQGKATSVLTKHYQQLSDQSAANAYRNYALARPGSKDQAKAKQALDRTLALSDNIDRLVASSDKDVQTLKAGFDKQQAHATADSAETDLQTEFENWKDNVWMWANVPEKSAEKMKAEGQKPASRIFADAQQEHDVAWEAFVGQMKDLDKYGDDDLPAAWQPARDAWLRRNQASDAALKADTGYDDAAMASTAAHGNVLEGDLARLQQDKADWKLANPDRFDQNFDGQEQLDQLSDGVAQSRIQGLQLGEDKQHNKYLEGVSAPDRADPEALKKAESKYVDENSASLDDLKRQIDKLGTAGLREKSDAVKAFKAQWAQRNPELQEKLDALGVTSSVSTERAADYRQTETARLLSASPQGRELQDANALEDKLQGLYVKRSDGNVDNVQTDYDGIKKDIDSHSFVRDAWDAATSGDSVSEKARDYTKDQLDKAKQLRNDLADGKISVSDYAKQEDQFLDAYDTKSADFARRIADNDGNWSIVDEAIRTTVIAAAGIGTTLLTGNAALGFGAAMAVSEAWDTTGDIVAAAQGRDVNADGHTSLWTLEAKAVTGNATWDDVKFTAKDEAIDVASNAVTATGLGAGTRVTAGLTAALGAKGTLQVGGRTLLNVGFKEGSTETLTLGGRAITGAGSNLIAQGGVDGVGRIGVETLHVGLDGQLGTEEGNQRIHGAVVNAAVGLATAPFTGAVSAAIPLNTGMRAVGIGGQVINDTVGSLGTGELISFANNGRSMNRAEFIASSLQIGPSVLQHVALHPMMVRAHSRTAAAAQGDEAGRPATPAVDEAGGPLADEVARARSVGVDDEPVLFKAGGDDEATPVAEQLPLYGDEPFKPAPAPRPRLEKHEGQRVADLVHLAGSTSPRAMNGKTVGLTQLEDGRMVVTISGKATGLSANQRRVAQQLLEESGFAPQDIVMLEGRDGNPHYQPASARHLDPDTRPVSWHAEQKGIQAGKLLGSDAVRQWSASGKNPRGTEEGGHGGAACVHCLGAQGDYRVVNETGIQPPKGEAAPHELSDGRRWGGRDDRVDRVLPGVDWESLRVRPAFLDAQPEEPLLQAARRGPPAPSDAAGWDRRFLERVALHPDVQAVLPKVLKQRMKGASDADVQQELQMLYGDPRKVHGAARDNWPKVRGDVLAAWHILEAQGKPIDIDGFTPIISPRPEVYRIRPSTPPRLGGADDFANAIDRVTSHAHDIAEALRSEDPASRIELKLLSGEDFRAEVRKMGKSPKSVQAFTRDEVVHLNRDSDPWEQLLAMVHEGTHALDYLTKGNESRARPIFIGDVEARAYHHENEFARAMGIVGKSDDETVFPTLVRPVAVKANTRDAHRHVDAVYPQANERWRGKAGGSGRVPVLYQQEGGTPAGDEGAAPASGHGQAPRVAGPVIDAFARGLRAGGLDLATDPAGMLLRIDTQSPDTLRAAGGMRPRPGVGVVTRPSLSNYVEANTPGRWVGTSKSVAHIGRFLADHPRRVGPGETAYLYVVNPAERSRTDVLQHYKDTGRYDHATSERRDMLRREGEVGIDGGLPWKHVVGWAEVDPVTGEFAGPFQHNADYEAPTNRPRQVITRMPRDDLFGEAPAAQAEPAAHAPGQAPAEPVSAQRAAAPAEAEPAAPQVQSTIPDLSTGWQPLLPLAAATPSLVVVSRAGNGPRAVFDPASGQWVETRRAPAANRSPAAAPRQGARAPDPAATTVTARAPDPDATTLPLNLPDPAATTLPDPAAATAGGVPPPGGRPPEPEAPASGEPEKPPVTRSRVVTATAIGTGALGVAGVLAYNFVPPELSGGTTLTWAIAGSVVRGSIKFARFTHARTWEGRAANMRAGLGAKAAFENALNDVADLASPRLRPGAPDARQVEFNDAMHALRDHDILPSKFPGLRQRTVGRQIDRLQAAAEALGIDPAQMRTLTDTLRAGAPDRVDFDRNLWLHNRFAERGAESGFRRLLHGVKETDATTLSDGMRDINAALDKLRNPDPGDDGEAMQQLQDAMKEVSVAPRLRNSKSPMRWVIDGVQVGTYGVSLATLSRALVSLPADWPATTAITALSISTIADGVRIGAVRLGAFRPSKDHAPLADHRFFTKTLPAIDDLALKYGGMVVIGKGTGLAIADLIAHNPGHSVLGHALDAAAGVVFMLGARHQRAESAARDYVDPPAHDTEARRKMLKARMFAAGGALVYAGDAVVQKLFFGPDDKKDDKDKNPVVTPSTRPTPTGSPTPTPGATALPTPGATASPTAPGTTPPTTPPSNPPTTPPPVKPPHTAPAHVVVTADDPRRATLWAIARENADSLLTPEQIAAARASGRDAETAAALRQLFQVNPQRGFRPELMDGIASAARGDPDTVRPGWEIDVENPAVG